MPGCLTTYHINATKDPASALVGSPLLIMKLDKDESDEEVGRFHAFLGVISYY